MINALAKDWTKGKRNNMSKRIQFMDILRNIAVLLVMWGHFISVGTFATDIPGIISKTSTLPILSQQKHNLWKVESWLIEIFHTQTAIIGVLLFFIITGYLIAMMQERYSSISFLTNRLFRIFPALIICIILNGLFVYLTQGIIFKPISYIASMTLIYNFILVAPVMGVLWTLVVEVLFYLLSAFVGKFTYKKLIYIYACIIMLIIILPRYNTNSNTLYIASIIRYISFILIGTTIYLSEKVDNLSEKIWMIFTSAVLSFSIFRLYYFIYTDTTTYPRIGSFAVTISIFIFFYILQNKYSRLFEHIPKFIYWSSKLVYPIYLLHVVFGLGTMYLLSKLTSNQYLILLGGLIASVAISILVHILVEEPFIKIGKKIIKKLEPKTKTIIIQKNDNLVIKYIKNMFLN